MANIPSEKIQLITGNVFPDMERIPYEDKQKPEYNLSMAKAIYSRYANNNCDVPSGTDEYIDSLRLIAQGKQSAEQYKNYFVGGTIPSINVLNDIDTTLNENAKSSREGWFTGMWDVLSPIPNMKTRCKGEFLNSDTDIKAFCTDMDANEKETLRMNMEWVKYNPKTKKVANALRQTIGLPQQDEEESLSYEALKDIKMEGGYKERYITAIEQLISHTEDISDWKMSLKEKLFDDIFDLGCAYAYDNYDHSECKVKWEYLDPKYAINQFAYNKDGSDSQYFGWFEFLSLNKIREIQDRITDGKKYGLSQEDFEKIAIKYKDYSDNKNSIWYKTKRDTIDVTACVVKVRWIDVEKRKESEYKGARLPYKEGHRNNSAYKVIETRKLKRYECSWLVGTDYVWDFGCAANQVFSEDSPTLGFTMFKMIEKSYIERLVPIAHAFAIEWLKFINAISKAQDDFYTIDASKLAQLSDGNKKYDPLDMIKVMRQENVFIYLGDNTSQGGDNNPAKRVQGTALESLQAPLLIMEQLLKQAEVLTGLSQMSVGATPNANTPVKTAMASLNASNTALSYIMNAVMIIKSKLSTESIYMISNLLEVEPKAIKAYSKVVGSDDVQSIKDNREGISALGIKLYPRPSEEMKERIVAYLQYAIQGGLIDGATALHVEYQLYRGGNFLEILYKVKYLVKKEQDRQFKEKQALIKEQSDGNAQAAQVQAQSGERLKIAELQATNRMINMKGEDQRLTDNNKAFNDIKALIVKDKQEKGENPEEILLSIDQLINEQRSRLINA
jgi:hypothetical protein